MASSTSNWCATSNFWLLSTVGHTAVTPGLTLKDTSNSSLILSAASNKLSCYGGATLCFADYLTDASCQNGIKFATSGLPPGVSLSNDGTLAVASNAAAPASASVTLAAINGWCNRESLPLQIQLLTVPPAGLSAAVFRYDASTLTGSNGQKVTSWGNLGVSGSGFDLLQTTSTKQPTLLITSSGGSNSVQGVKFTAASNQWLGNAAALTGGAVTGIPFKFVFSGSNNTSNVGLTSVSVVTCATTAFNPFLSLYSGTGSNVINTTSNEFMADANGNFYTNVLSFTASNTSTVIRTSTTVVRNNIRQIFVTRVQNGAGSNKQQWEFFLNSNVALSLELGGGSSNVTILDRQYHRVQVGAYLNNFYLNGTIHEEAIFDKVLPDSELASIMTQLRTKWSVT